MNKIRKAHVWISLVTSVLLLLGGITGLSLGLSSSGFSRPAFGQNFNGGTGGFKEGLNRGTWNPSGAGSSNSGSPSNNTGSGSSSGHSSAAGQNRPFQSGNFPSRRGNSFNMTLMQIVRGQFHGQDIRWLLDLVSALIILLTLGGLYTSVRLLRVKVTDNATD